ncbi:MAG: type II secretion system F family protein [Alphaproteobacteria bacterium]
MLGLSTELMIVVGTAVSTTLLFLIVAMAFRRDPMDARIKSVMAQRGARRSAARNLGARQSMAVFMRRTVEKFDLLRSNQAKQMSERLAQAGWRRADATIVYLFCKTVLPLGVAAMAIFAVYGLNLFSLSPLMKLVVVIGAALAGSYAPELFIRNAVQKRATEVRRNLPDALDLMVVCTEAGLALDAAMERVAREIAGNSLAMADELGHAVIELRFLPERRKALENLAQRTVSVPGVQALVNTLIQTERFGTPLAQSLRVLAAELRTQRMVKAEEKAARLPAIMTVPLIVFILPALFLVLLGPAILDLIDMFAKM